MKQEKQKNQDHNIPLKKSNRPNSLPRTCQSHPLLQTVSISLNPPVRDPLPLVAAQVRQIMLDYNVYLVEERKISKISKE
jgi:hypothetical protein